MDIEKLKLLEELGIDIGPIKKILELRDKFNSTNDPVEKIALLKEMGLIDDDTYKRLVKFITIAKAFKPKK